MKISKNAATALMQASTLLESLARSFLLPSLAFAGRKPKTDKEAGQMRATHAVLLKAESVITDVAEAFKLARSLTREGANYPEGVDPDNLGQVADLVTEDDVEAVFNALGGPDKDDEGPEAADGGDPEPEEKTVGGGEEFASYAASKGPEAGLPADDAADPDEDDLDDAWGCGGLDGEDAKDEVDKAVESLPGR